MAFKTIISCHDLFKQINTENWVIIDCRFDLADTEWGEQEYRSLHIPGAIYAHLDHDLSGIKTPLTGRHPLPDSEVFCKTMSRFGIDKETQVIVYDATNGSYASRLWFLLRLYGHTKVALLDGGFAQWYKESLPIESGWCEKLPRHFTGQPDMDLVVSTNDVEAMIGKTDWLLVDARAPERFHGEQETIDTVAGHIPGAVNRFYGTNQGPEGLFLSADRLREEFNSLTKGIRPDHTAIYCGSGVTSCHHLVAMAIAGLPQPRLYAGSWSEWIRDPKRPIVQTNKNPQP